MSDVIGPNTFNGIILLGVSILLGGAFLITAIVGGLIRHERLMWRGLVLAIANGVMFLLAWALLDSYAPRMKQIAGWADNGSILWLGLCIWFLLRKGRAG
ncbi:hypothetical protein IAI18_21465 [Acetobacteraceae bacterium H6797]|nr:hypothetical protein [Acetobacteraceae bacterium H6797]